MISAREIKTRIFHLLASFMLVLITISVSAAEAPVIVELTQRPCIIIEAEDDPAEYLSKKKSDCIRINKETAANRVFKVLRLKPGKTIFRVTNLNVPYDLGFWVRGKGVSRITLPSVSGGGLKTGATIDYQVDLKEGEYYYSCPLNPTPNYPLIVAD